MEKEKFDLENFPTSNSARKMLSYVSDGFYDESYVGKWIYQVVGLEYDKALEMVEDLPAQFFPETATWGLMYHEIKWGLPVRENLSFEERRKRIYQKRDYRAPMTPYRMEKSLEAATGFEVHIADIHDPGEYGFFPQYPNVFKVFFLGEKTLNTKFASELLNQMKQSHTVFIINDRVVLGMLKDDLEKLVLKNIRLKISVPFYPVITYDETIYYDGSSRYDAMRKYKLGMRMRLYLEMGCPDENIINMSIETRRNVQYYNAEKRYDGSSRYDAMLRKDVIQ